MLRNRVPVPKRHSLPASTSWSEFRLSKDVSPMSFLRCPATGQQLRVWTQYSLVAGCALMVGLILSGSLLQGMFWPGFNGEWRMISEGDVPVSGGEESMLPAISVRAQSRRGLLPPVQGTASPLILSLYRSPGRLALASLPCVEWEFRSEHGFRNGIGGPLRC